MSSAAASKHNDKGKGTVSGSTDPNVGVLGPIAARVLVKVLYGARMATFDLLRAVCRLACFVTTWITDCGRKLHRWMCYVHATPHYRLVGWRLSLQIAAMEQRKHLPWVVLQGGGFNRHCLISGDS